MSRDIGATNISHVDGNHVHPVLLVKFVFDTPLYVHSGIGSIVYDSNTYLGVGGLGSVDGVEESESISPSPVKFTLSGLDGTHISEALDAGNFGDVITVYEGYRSDDGTLIDDPYQVARGTYDNADIRLGSTNTVTVTMQHDLAKLSQSQGRKYTDEDQQDEFVGDTGFSFVTDSIEKTLNWGGQTDIQGGGGSGPDGRRRRVF